MIFMKLSYDSNKRFICSAARRLFHCNCKPPLNFSRIITYKEKVKNRLTRTISAKARFSKPHLILSRTYACGQNDPPSLPEMSDCCEDGCENCVWLKYVIEVKFYYGNNKEKIQEAIDAIPESDIRTFVEMELKNKIKNSKKSTLDEN